MASALPTGAAWVIVDGKKADWKDDLQADKNRLEEVLLAHNKQSAEQKVAVDLAGNVIIWQTVSGVPELDAWQRGSHTGGVAPYTHFIGLLLMPKGRDSSGRPLIHPVKPVL